MNKKQEAAKAELDFQAKNLKAHEILWQDKWEAAENPFIAIKQYRKDAPKRKPIIDAWLCAVEKWEMVRPKEGVKKSREKVLKPNPESYACTSNRTNSATAGR